MVDEIEKEKKDKLVEASPEIIHMLLDAQTSVKNTYFPDDNRIDRMNDRKQQLSECASYISGNIQTLPDANWLTAVGNEVTGKCFTPPKSTNVIVPYGSESQTNHNSSDYIYELKDFIFDPVDKLQTFSDCKHETNQFSTFE
jgi:hypothetical protein